MTINSHLYLVSRGWKGKGSALREGGISRPVVQAQKKDQKGLGTNRDDGFQFWDHVYAAAADAIKIHVEDSEEADEDMGAGQGSRLSALVTPAESTEPEKERTGLSVTQTGILSSRRPSELKRASTGGLVNQTIGRTGVDPLVLAKREAAKRELYSRFYRGKTMYEEERPDPLECMERVLHSVSNRDETDDKWETPIGLAGTDEKRSRREEKRKRKEEKGESKKGQRGSRKRRKSGSGSS